MLRRADYTRLYSCLPLDSLRPLPPSSPAPFSSTTLLLFLFFSFWLFPSYSLSGSSLSSPFSSSFFSFIYSLSSSLVYSSKQQRPLKLPPPCFLEITSDLIGKSFGGGRRDAFRHFEYGNTTPTIMLRNGVKRCTNRSYVQQFVSSVTFLSHHRHFFPLRHQPLALCSSTHPNNTFNTTFLASLPLIIQP